MSIHLELEKKIENYVTSINQLDLDLGRSLWLDNDKVSFIHPRGHSVGVNDIINAFYVETMGRFSSRDLRVKNLDMMITDQTAVVTFYWDFYAVFKADNDNIETHGRETQVFVKEGEDWKLTHIHYSPMPVVAEKEGF